MSEWSLIMIGDNKISDIQYSINKNDSVVFRLPKVLKGEYFRNLADKAIENGAPLRIKYDDKTDSFVAEALEEIACYTENAFKNVKKNPRMTKNLDKIFVEEHLNKIKNIYPIELVMTGTGTQAVIYFGSKVA